MASTQPELETMPIVLATTMGTEEWDLRLPVDVAVQALISKLVRTPELPFREQDDAGRPVPYRLMWREGNRYLSEAETLRSANVQAGHTLVMAHEARAGGTVGARPPQR